MRALSYEINLTEKDKFSVISCGESKTKPHKTRQTVAIRVWEVGEIATVVAGSECLGGR